MPKYQHKITLKDLLKEGEKISSDNRQEASQKIGKLALDLLKKDCAEYKSCVTGKPFKHLKKGPYRDKKGTNRSDMRLTSDMLDSMESKAFKYGARIDIKGEKNSLKAENHLKRDNDGGGVARAAEKKTGVPQRKFFPTGAEKFRAGILKKLRAEIEDLIE
jgi:hypothetical protein